LSTPKIQFSHIFLNHHLLWFAMDSNHQILGNASNSTHEFSLFRLLRNSFFENKYNPGRIAIPATRSDIA